MYRTLPTFILGFHGCDQSVVDSIVEGSDQLQASNNDYDWLGHGIYFWENDPDRALEYAKIIQDDPKRGKGIISEPAVVGAIIDLGYCLNIMETKALDSIRTAYNILKATLVNNNIDIPVNTSVSGSRNDLLLRRLDCAVIQILHEENTERQFDTVRGLFIEGEDLYPNAGFKIKNHIQVCVRNPNCIKGYFLPRSLDEKHPIP